MGTIERTDLINNLFAAPCIRISKLALQGHLVTLLPHIIFIREQNILPAFYLVSHL